MILWSDRVDRKGKVYLGKLNASSSNKLQYKHDNCDHEENVNQAANSLTRKSETKSPKYEQDDDDCPKHK
jgi:hypothetical protein